MNIEAMKDSLKERLSPKRFNHSLGVMNTSIELAKNYGEDVERARIAGLLHDCARDIRGQEAIDMCKSHGVEVDAIALVQPELLHGPLGAALARELYGIEDEGILKAIFWHTTGHENMELFEKIIFIADYIEPGRKFPGVEEARKLAFADINKAVVHALDSTIGHVLSKGSLIHPATIVARNYVILHG